jgi:hypothetical protein
MRILIQAGVKSITRAQAVTNTTPINHNDHKENINTSGSKKYHQGAGSDKCNPDKSQ